MDYAGEFLSTPSARRATQLEIFGEREYIISIHALREEGDPRSIMRLQVRYNFYPRPPRGGRPWPRSGSRWTSAFLSTPSARRATRSSAVVDGQRAISIHALREEGDGKHRRTSYPQQNFYPRPPRGGRPINQLRQAFQIQFLSTPSARRATARRLSRPQSTRYFYPRPPRGGRLPSQCHSQMLFSDFYPRPPRGGRQRPIPRYFDKMQISIHALREEGDSGTHRPSLKKEISIHALREEGDARFARACACTVIISIHALREEGDKSNGRHEKSGVISIHALREEGDLPLSGNASVKPYDFYPRPPRGGRQCTGIAIIFIS